MKNVKLAIFKKEQLDQIEQAIKRIEARTEAEIVTFVALQSGVYWGAHILCTLFFYIISLGFQLFLTVKYPWAAGHLDLVLIPFAGILLGGLISFIPGVQRVIIPPKIKQQRVEERAYFLFSKLGVHQTEARAGILIYLSLFERKVFLLADKGIYEKMPKAFWDSQTAALSKNISAGEELSGFIQLINTIGAKLIEFFPRTNIKKNELPDAPQTPSE